MSDLQGTILKRYIRNQIVALFILATVWGVLTTFIGEGTIMLITNILFMFFTIGIAVTLIRSLRYFMNHVFAFIVSMLLWFLFNVLYRSFF